MSKREPIFNVPGAVAGALLLILAVHGIRQVLTEAQDEWFVIAMAFVPARYAGAAAELPGGMQAMFSSPLTHMLVHGDVIHLALNSAWLLAFGGAIGRRAGNWGFLLFSIFCGIAGAAAFYAAHPGALVPVVGASGALSGLMAGALRLLFSATGSGGIRMLRETPELIELEPLKQALRDARLQWATGFWIVLNVLAIFGVGTGGHEGAIAWEAHVGGFIAGLLFYGYFDAEPQISSHLHKEPTLH